MRKFFTSLWEIIKILVIVVIVVAPIRYYVFQPFLVKGQSMEPNFSNANYLIIDEISYRFQEPKRGEVIVFKYPRNPSQRYVKRIIGLPHETVQIKDNQVIIYPSQEDLLSFFVLDESEYLPTALTLGSVKATLTEDEYFVLGDNRAFSSDSRHWGTLQKQDIIGRTILRLWPIASINKISPPVYDYKGL